MNLDREMFLGLLSDFFGADEKRNSFTLLQLDEKDAVRYSDLSKDVGVKAEVLGPSVEYNLSFSPRIPMYAVKIFRNNQLCLVGGSQNA